VEVYTEVMAIFLRVLQTPVERQSLHAAVRQYLHRMVVCLETEVLPYVPVALENLLKDPDTRELHEFLPLLIQIITKFRVSQCDNFQLEY
jgi:exportin-T